ncbi:MAG: GlsB/YeaQ/YmgE family stress response membrane protein [Thermomicrobiales bacterium]
MGILAWILLGALAGWLASIITGSNERMGCFANIAVGIIGAFIGGAIVSALGGAGITGFNLWSLLVAVLGSIILLAIVQAVRR